MDLQQYLVVLRERWRSILLVTLIGMLAAAALAWHATPMYSASTQLFISSTGADSTAAAYQGSQFDQDRVISYAKIVNSPDVVSKARTELGLTQSLGSLRGEISASAPLNTVLLNISVKDASPARAAAIANAVGASFIDYVNALETPQGVATSPIKATTTLPATAPGSPVSPNKKLDLALGFLVGLALGVGFAVARAQLDTRVKADTDVEPIGGGPLLVTIDEDPSVTEHPTIYTGDPFGHRAEAFRTLRTNLSFVSAAEGASRLVVSSPLPGDGKTSSVVNLGVAYAQAGRKVLLIDADLRRPSMASALGLNPSVGLTNVLVDPSLLATSIQRWQPELSLDVLASGPIPPNPSELLGGDRMRRLLEGAAAQYDVVICDTPPLLLVTDAAVLAALADGVVIVCRTGRTRKEQLRHAAESISISGATVLGVVLNRAPRKRAGDRYYTYGYSYRSLEMQSGKRGRKNRRSGIDDDAAAASDAKLRAAVAPVGSPAGDLPEPPAPAPVQAPPAAQAPAPVAVPVRSPVPEPLARSGNGDHPSAEPTSQPVPAQPSGVGSSAWFDEWEETPAWRPVPEAPTGPN